MLKEIPESLSFVLYSSCSIVLDRKFCYSIYP
jgi:hypothetical protein